ncbi:cation:proton antiporter subunit C [Hyphomonadaceae bacterium ML37]|nr:cation:proton antiporter subunit C [Hyphomonadaceae bacterium ML37]
MLEILGDRFTFAVILVLMMVGLYAVIATGNLVKRMVGLSIFQTSVFLLYIATAKVTGGAPAIFNYSDLSAGTIPDDAVYANPLPHVLILTAIVVGVATLAMGLALVVRIREIYGTIEDDELSEIDHDDELKRGV